MSVQKPTKDGKQHAASMAQTISRERGDVSYKPACIIHSSIDVAMPSARLIHTL